MHAYALLHTHMHAPTTQKEQRGKQHSKKMQLHGLRGAWVQQDSDVTLATQSQPRNYHVLNSMHLLSARLRKKEENDSCLPGNHTAPGGHSRNPVSTVCVPGM